MELKPTLYGVDVALSRADDLDKRMLAYVSERDGLSVLDLGAGGGGKTFPPPPPPPPPPPVRL